jgi:type IV pilus assembly protein PilX
MMRHSKLLGSHRFQSQQRGVVLIISLIMLVIMTIIGLTGVRLVSTQERMVGYTYDRAVAFQATEAALREIEALIDLANQPAPAAGANCALAPAGAKQLNICGLPAANTTPRWKDTSFNSWQNASAIKIGSIEINPQYFVEYLGNNFPCDLNDTTPDPRCRRYRITARSAPDAERAAVVLQSIYGTFQ